MRVRVRVPASSANLGPGFDALGLALALYNDITVEESDEALASIEGEGADRLERGGGNVVVRAVRTAFEATGRSFRGASIHCVNRIPLRRGLGSSAAAWVSGLVGGNALLGEPLDREALLGLAARAEGHPDNVTAAMLGGLTVSCSAGERVTGVALPVPASVKWVVLVPDAESSTSEARAVLPETVSRADAVFNVQRASLLLAALVADRADLLGVAMHDRLHQPYRAKLFPWMERISAAAREAGALGCVLSGAGPSMLAAVRGAPIAVASAMERALADAGLTGRVLPLGVDVTGATWSRV